MRYDVVLHDAPSALEFDIEYNHAITVPNLSQGDMETLCTILGRHGVEFFAIPFLGDGTEG